VQITIVQKSITLMNTDAIVRPVGDLPEDKRSAVSAVFQAAGAEELESALQGAESSPPGTAVITPAFRLAVRYIIHAVLPVWKEDEPGSARKVRNAYKRSLDLAVAHGCQSLAFVLLQPVGCSAEQAWQLAFDACREFERKNRGEALEVFFCVQSESQWSQGQKSLRAMTSKEKQAKTGRILCFGDSLTWGYDPATRARFDESRRWPCVMQNELGKGWKLVEEGQCGRTIATNDPAEGEKNGLTYLLPCLESHSPLDVMVIMLGTNDCKGKFHYSPMDIAGEMQLFLEKVQSYNRFRLANAMKVLLVAPPVIGEEIEASWLGDSFGGLEARKKSCQLAGWYERLAAAYGVSFLNAADYAAVSPVDSIHMDAENQVLLGEAIAKAVAAL